MGETEIRVYMTIAGVKKLVEAATVFGWPDETPVKMEYGDRSRPDMLVVMVKDHHGPNPKIGYRRALG